MRRPSDNGLLGPEIQATQGILPQLEEIFEMFELLAFKMFQKTTK
jgi:hypothetical protein